MSNVPNTKDSEQVILNSSFNPDFGVLETLGLVYNPATDTLDKLTQPGSAFDSYQYMGTDSTSSATYKYVAFKRYAGVGFYCMRIHQTNANDVDYYYDTDGTTSDFNTFWADPSDAGYTYGAPPDS